MILAAALVLALVAAATALGLAWRARTGRVAGGSGERVDLAALGLPTGGRGATLLQLSTSRCAACRPTAALLARLAAEHEGVTHHEVLLDDRPDLAETFGVLQTPTVLLLDHRGAVRHRIGGTPGAPEVRQAVTAVLEAREIRSPA